MSHSSDFASFRSALVDAEHHLQWVSDPEALDHAASNLERMDAASTVATQLKRKSARLRSAREKARLVRSAQATMATVVGFVSTRFYFGKERRRRQVAFSGPDRRRTSNGWPTTAG